MMLFHTSCPMWKDRNVGPVPRFRIVAQSVHISTRKYVCERCKTVIHIDTDWEEGVEVEPNATFK